MSETEKVDVSTDLLEQQKAKAVEYLRMLGIFKPYIKRTTWKLYRKLHEVRT